LKGLQSHPVLGHINLENNEIIDLTDMKYLRDLALLRQLNMKRNPLQDLPDYRLSVLFKLPRLTELDTIKVSPDEKVDAANMFDPSLELLATLDHMTNVRQRLLNQKFKLLHWYI
jgi:hypothetical protein